MGSKPAGKAASLGIGAAYALTAAALVAAIVALGASGLDDEMRAFFGFDDASTERALSPSEWESCFGGAFAAAMPCPIGTSDEYRASIAQVNDMELLREEAATQDGGA